MFFTKETAGLQFAAAPANSTLPTGDILISVDKDSAFAKLFEHATARDDEGDKRFFTWWYVHAITFGAIPDRALAAVKSRNVIAAYISLDKLSTIWESLEPDVALLSPARSQGDAAAQELLKLTRATSEVSIVAIDLFPVQHRAVVPNAAGVVALAENNTMFTYEGLYKAGGMILLANFFLSAKNFGKSSDRPQNSNLFKCLELLATFQDEDFTILTDTAQNARRSTKHVLLRLKGYRVPVELTMLADGAYVNDATHYSHLEEELDFIRTFHKNHLEGIVDRFDNLTERIPNVHRVLQSSSDLHGELPSFLHVTLGIGTPVEVLNLLRAEQELESFQHILTEHEHESTAALLQRLQRAIQDQTRTLEAAAKQSADHGEYDRAQDVLQRVHNQLAVKATPAYKNLKAHLLNSSLNARDRLGKCLESDLLSIQRALVLGTAPQSDEAAMLAKSLRTSASSYLGHRMMLQSDGKLNPRFGGVLPVVDATIASQLLQRKFHLVHWATLFAAYQTAVAPGFRAAYAAAGTPPTVFDTPAGFFAALRFIQERLDDCNLKGAAVDNFFTELESTALSLLPTPKRSKDLADVLRSFLSYEHLSFQGWIDGPPSVARPPVPSSGPAFDHLRALQKAADAAMEIERALPLAPGTTTSTPLKRGAAESPESSPDGDGEKKKKKKKKKKPKQDNKADTDKNPAQAALENDTFIWMPSPQSKGVGELFDKVQFVVDLEANNEEFWRQHQASGFKQLFTKSTDVEVRKKFALKSLSSADKAASSAAADESHVRATPALLQFGPAPAKPVAPLPAATVLVVLAKFYEVFYVLLGPDQSLPLVELRGGSRDDSVVAAGVLARALLGREQPPPVFLAQDIVHQDFAAAASSLRVVACPLLAASWGDIRVYGSTVLAHSSGGTSAWQLVPMNLLTGSAVELPARVATAAVLSMAEQAMAPAFTPPAASPSSAASTAAWELVRRRHDAAQHLVRQALLADKSYPAEERIQFADAVTYSKPISGLDDVAMAQRRVPSADRDQRWKLEPFSEPVPSPTTSPLPPLRRQPTPPTAFRPTCLRDLLAPEAHERLRLFLLANKKDMEDLRKNGAESRRRFKPAPLVLGQSDMVVEARGIIWDLRRVDEGIVKPVDFDEPIVSDLNMDFLMALLSGTPDRELLDHLKLGAYLKADDMPLQTVLMPHLDSIGDNFDLVTAELERLEGKGWHQIYTEVPFFPVRFCPNGTVSRKHEKGRPRRTTDASAPHKVLRDTGGVAAVPLNVAVKKAAPDGTARWPREQKPTVLAKVRDLAILRYSARVFKSEIFGFCLDFADFFSQINVAHRYHWLNVVHWLEVHKRSGSYGVFVNELRLGFGVACSSNIAQRLSDAILAAFRKIMDNEDKQFFATVRRSGSQEQREWLAARETLGARHVRLFEISMFTDDPMLVAVGIDRFLLCMRKFIRVAKAAGLALAIPAKWHIGVALRWLGLDWLLVPGLVVLPASKRLRAINDIGTIVAEPSVRFQTYRSTVSFLTYLRPFLADVNRTYLYGLFDVFSSGDGTGTPAPLAFVTISAETRHRLREWLHVLTTITGVFYSEASAAVTPPSCISSIIVSIYGDAALEGVARAARSSAPPEPDDGIGGFCHGLYWRLALTERWRRTLSISPLEFGAIFGNCIVFENYVGAARAHLCTDSSNCRDVMVNEHAGSKVMRYLHRRVLDEPAYKRLQTRATVLHVYGPANPASDAVSRAKWDYLNVLCEQLGVVPRELPPPPELSALLNDACDYVDSMNASSSASPPPQALRASALAVLGGRGKRVRGQDAGDGPRVVRPPLGGTDASPPHGDGGSAPGTDAGKSYKYTFRRPPLGGSECHSSAPSPSSTASATATSSARLRRPPLGGGGTGLPNEDKGAMLAFADGNRYKHACHRPPLGGTGSHSSTPSPAPTANAAAWSGAGFGAAARSRKRRRPPLSSGVAEAAGVPSTVPRSGLASARAKNLYEALVVDTSPLALRPDDPDELLALCHVVMETADGVHAANTLKVDDLAWERWKHYCALKGTPPLREDFGASDTVFAKHRETVLLSGFFLHCTRIILPRSSKNAAAKPQSSFNMVLAVLRVHRRLGVELRVGPLLQRTFHSHCKKYVAEHGAEALIPSRKEPLDAPRIRAILRVPHGTPCGPRTVDWSKPFFLCIRAMLCVMFAAAFRKAEAALPAGVTVDGRRLLRSSVTWKLNDVLVADPTPGQLRSLRQGDFCIVVPPLLKNDDLGTHFGWKPVWLPYDNDAVNAASAVADLFLAVPIAPSKRAETLLFCVDSHGSPMTHPTADGVLKHLLRAAFPTEDSSRFSWHSLRIGCASALLAAGASYGLIQALCRWRSHQSIDIYARLGPVDYGRWVSIVQRQTVDALTVRRLPRLDMDGVIAFLHNDVDAADAAGQQVV